MLRNESYTVKLKSGKQFLITKKKEKGKTLSVGELLEMTILCFKLFNLRNIDWLLMILSLLFKSELKITQPSWLWRMTTSHHGQHLIGWGSINCLIQNTLCHLAQGQTKKISLVSARSHNPVPLNSSNFHYHWSCQLGETQICEVSLLEY